MAQREHSTTVVFMHSSTQQNFIQVVPQALNLARKAAICNLVVPLVNLKTKAAFYYYYYYYYFRMTNLKKKKKFITAARYFPSYNEVPATVGDIFLATCNLAQLQLVLLKCLYTQNHIDFISTSVPHIANCLKLFSEQSVKSNESFYFVQLYMAQKPIRLLCTFHSGNQAVRHQSQCFDIMG